MTAQGVKYLCFESAYETQNDKVGDILRFRASIDELRKDSLASEDVVAF